MSRSAIISGIVLLIWLPLSVKGQSHAEKRFELNDVFQLEYASAPRISPDGSRVVYVRNFMDIMKDARRSNLWIINADGTDHRPLTTGVENDRSPSWSPDGHKLLFVSDNGGKTQLFVRWMDTGQTAMLTHLTQTPGGIAWSPNGKWIALTMFVAAPKKSMARLPKKPKGAEWAEPPRVITRLRYRADGRGYLKDGYVQLFVLPADGGTPRQLTFGLYNHNGTPSWTPDGTALIFSANGHSDGEYDPQNSEIYDVALEDGAIHALTDRHGPDTNPIVSPDGKHIAYLGFDDHYQGYQITRLYVMDRDGSHRRSLTNNIDRSIQNPKWSGNNIFFQYDDEGDTKIGRITLPGKFSAVAEHVGGMSIGRPYSAGAFSVSPDGQLAFTFSLPNFPADLAIQDPGGETLRLTSLNADLFDHKQLGQVEEVRYNSSFDGREIQGWVVYPPNFEASEKYPLILEIHGGPFANYGDRFSAEIQLYAAAGYVVLYVNPRGSTSYGQEFGNLIHHNYPGQDYDDLMSGVDTLLKRGIIDENNLFVTGGSGGGVLSAWIVGKTNRFNAAVVAKPVINWTSFALTSDAYNFFYKYWFPGFPWDFHEQYWERSPLSLVGHVETPTMLLTGESDHRTPITETEQFYQALKLRKVETAMVRIPETGHGIAGRPSRLIAKVAYILAWFAGHRTDSTEATK